MEGTHTFPQITTTPTASSEILSNEQIEAIANQAQDEWEASQGPNFQPLEDHERQEMIMDRYEDLIKRRDTQEERAEIENVLGKAA